MPPSQNVGVGDTVNVVVAASTNGSNSCGGAVFLQFDTTLLSFVTGSNNTASWGFGTNSPPHIGDPGVVALSVGQASPPVDAQDVLVSSLQFTAIANGTANLTLLQDGMRDTIFYTCALAPYVTLLSDAVVIIAGTPTPTTTATQTPTFTPTPPTPTRTPTLTPTIIGSCNTNADCPRGFVCRQTPTVTPTLTPTPLPPSWCASFPSSCTQGGPCAPPCTPVQNAGCNLSGCATFTVTPTVTPTP